MGFYVTQINKDGTVAVDDTILVKDVLASAGSHMLDGFKPLFSAEAVERLEKAGYVISGKTNVGEFGLDLLGETSYYGASEKDGNLVGASAALVAEGEIKGAINVDLNGAPRRAAAISGVDFIKPTYGTVSRYGIMACACSGEQIGVTASKAEDVKELLTVIAGDDSKDGTSLPEGKYEYSTDLAVAKMRVCVISNLTEKVSPAMAEKVGKSIDALKSLGAEVDMISFDEASAAQTAWQILMAAETCNNVSRYDGVKYGYRTPNYKNIDELYINSRTEGMSYLTKATILYGSDVLSKGRYEQCYDKALRIRRVVLEKIKDILSKYDAILIPACSQAEYKAYDVLDSFGKVFDESIFTAIPSLTGLPAMVTSGVQFISDSFKESVLLSIAHSLEEMEA